MIRGQSSVGTAVIIGASSGIGEALARRMGAAGWRLVLLARRIERLKELAVEIGGNMWTAQIDVAAVESAVRTFERIVDEAGSVDLVIISAGTGFINPQLEWELDCQTLAVNVMGFAALAQSAMRYFLERGQGHLVGITSVGGLRGDGPGAAYTASKAFQSTYLDGLRDLARRKAAAVTVTEAQPGFVATAMMKADRPFWIASADRAADDILRAINGRAKHVYVTQRWALIAFLLRRLPRPG